MVPEASSVNWPYGAVTLGFIKQPVSQFCFDKKLPDAATYCRFLKGIKKTCNMVVRIYNVALKIVSWRNQIPLFEMLALTDKRCKS